MSKNDLIMLANIFSDMNDFIDSNLCPSNSWKSAIVRGVLFAYRDELIARILNRKTFKKYSYLKEIEFKKIAKNRKVIE